MTISGTARDRQTAVTLLEAFKATFSWSPGTAKVFIDQVCNFPYQQ